MKTKRFGRELPLHLMILPGAALIFIYHYIPMVGVAIAFQKFVPIRGITGSSWVGLDNFIFVLQLPDTLKVVANTLTIAVMKIVAGLVVPIGIALLLNEIGRTAFKRTVQTLIYLPHFLSWTILAGILIDVLSPSSGLVNQALEFIGLEPIFFLGDNRWFPFTLVISNEWKEFGFSTIVYLAAISSIDPSLYESAVIDGAGHWRRTWHVTLPGIRPIVVLLMTLSLGQILNAGFEQVFNLYSPIVYESGDIIDTMVYRMGLINAQYSFATAIGLMKALVSLILIAVSYMLAYRFANYRIF
ncbi:putative aldouronate transport system permease protein [Paenibacillus eucommiae]|uniref:Aldouronate transport system permease protein n=2 Tax=Paenibacillus eucommiae TaxID=1355755 RepID=A0ABS4IVI9_9BACL|nr:ABC transporter permease subunit [Paenibacillus eucommiae]MBP1991528.1 putative aldouronate transport system permease protein [Paenibacillus eucommiae]